uniref:Uncharacterized protein n=1 Tax=Onchocerca volvulus TaxID=6282 RepID=A0A8R1XVA1_ONCVO
MKMISAHQQKNIFAEEQKQEYLKSVKMIVFKLNDSIFITQKTTLNRSMHSSTIQLQNSFQNFADIRTEFPLKELMGSSCCLSISINYIPINNAKPQYLHSTHICDFISKLTAIQIIKRISEKLLIWNMNFITNIRIYFIRKISFWARFSADLTFHNSSRFSSVPISTDWDNGIG